MSNVSMKKPTQTCIMEAESHEQNGVPRKLLDLLELSASNDLNGFRIAIEEGGHGIDEPSLWYGRRICSKKMGFEERTPLLIASIFGCKDIVNYIVKSGRVDVNRACGSDGARALHCAAVGGSPHSPDVVKILLEASADTDSVDANGNRPADLIAPACCNSDFNYRRMMLEALLRGNGNVVEHQVDFISRVRKDGNEKKDYPYDLVLPDIKNGLYVTDEFRMYTFKIQPCSRAYSHDWTECPFVHPGENARRRDPRKYLYSCVPCPEFRKGSCNQGDNCEYAHGIFESWLHPAQYRTRLCKDETNCTRRVCFFAHKPEELRPLYALTGSAVPSPRSYDLSSMSPLAQASPSIIKPSKSTPSLTPTGTSSLGPSKSTPSLTPTGVWPNESSIAPPTLQLPSSRLKSARSGRVKDFNMEKLSLESHRRFQHQQQQQLIDEVSGHMSTNGWSNSLSSTSPYYASGDRTWEFNRCEGAKTTNHEDIFASLDMQGISLEPQTNLASSPVMESPTFGVETSKRNPSIIERPSRIRPSGFSTPTSPVSAMPPNLGYSTPASPVSAMPPNLGYSTPASPVSAMPPNLGYSTPASPVGEMPHLSDWSSPDGKLDWGIQGDELTKLRKSASLVFLGNGCNFSMSSNGNEADANRFQSHMKRTPFSRQFRYENQ